MNENIAEQEQVQEINLEELINQTSEKQESQLPPIEIDLGAYDNDEFKKGITETSYLAGTITALLNTGVSEGFILEYLINKDTIQHNLDVTKLNNNAQIEISKNQKMSLDKQEI